MDLTGGPLRLRCPACGSDKDANFYFWKSEYSLASHIVSKAKAGDDTHVAWVKQTAQETMFASWMDSQDGSTKFTDHDKPIIAAVAAEVAAVHSARGSQSTVETTTGHVALLQNIERALHTHIRKRLQADYGEVWWRAGVPADIRKECVMRREDDTDANDPWGYTTLIELKKVIEKQWKLFEVDLRRCQPELSNRKGFVAVFDQVNRLRNKYMHPVRAPLPGGPDANKDLEDLNRHWAIVRRFCDLQP